MNPRLFLILFLGVLTALRLVLIGVTELAPDEAYYFMWSERLDWSYYSKGPGVALAIKAGTSLFGPTEFGIRFLSPMLSLGTSILLYFFARRLYGEREAFWLVIVANCLPIFNVGSLVMTIDPLSIFFWTAGVYSLWLALEKGVSWNWFWVLSGLMAGLGFLSKYTNALQILSAILFLSLSRAHRKAFVRPGFYAMLASFLICAVPPIIWNAMRRLTCV